MNMKQRLPQKGTQGVVKPVAYQVGLQCPPGREIDLVLGLETFWPGLRAEEAVDDLLRGLIDRGTAEE